MEGLIEPANCVKRPFIILQISLTLLATNTIYASNENPILPDLAPNKELTFSAVPIIANTIATYNNLKTAKIIAPTEKSKAIPVVVTAKSVVAPEEMFDAAKVEAISVETNEAVTKIASTSFSFAALSKEERRQYIAYFAESYTDWGFSYRFGGTSIEKGIDCSAFTRYILNYFDIKAPRTSGEQFDVGEKIAVEQAKAGDLVFFGSKKSITHVALVVSNDEKGLVVVHSCGRGIIKENITESSYWKPKLKSTAVNIFDTAQDSK